MADNKPKYNSMDELYSIMKKNKVKVTDSSNSNKFSNEILINVIQEVAWESRTTDDIAAKGIIGVLNQGGTSARAQDKIYVQINEHKIILGDIRKALKKHAGNNATLRKLARSFGTKAFEVSKELNIRGNLANKLQQMDSSLSPDELIWAADFQQSNPDCPEKIRNLLRRHYEENIKKK